MKAVVWSKQNCQYCDMAKNLLKGHGIEFEEKKIGVDCTPDDLRNILPNARTVPQIFLNEEYVGGFTELKAKLNEMGNKHAVNS